MHKGKVYQLNDYEIEIVKLVANQRHNNKVETGWDGYGTVNKKSTVDLHVAGFGAEFLFCKELNLCPDFSIGNTSKRLGTDQYDALFINQTVDVKVNRNPENPLMIPNYCKSDCDLFALFSCKFPKYRFEGFATNEMVFQDCNLRMTRVLAYVLEKKKLLSLNELNI